MIFSENWLLSLISQATSNLFTEDIAIYIIFTASFTYELLLFSLALWAAIQCFRCSSPATRHGARHLRVILIEGNVIYFLAWVLSLVSEPWLTPDTTRILLHQVVFTPLALAKRVGFFIYFGTTENRQFWDLEFICLSSNFFCCLVSITGCRLILDIRSVTSQSSTTSINVSHDSRGQICSFIVFLDPTTHDSTDDDTASE